MVTPRSAEDIVVLPLQFPLSANLLNMLIDLHDAEAEGGGAFPLRGANVGGEILAHPTQVVCGEFLLGCPHHVSLHLGNGDPIHWAVYRPRERTGCAAPQT